MPATLFDVLSLIFHPRQNTSRLERLSLEPITIGAGIDLNAANASANIQFMGAKNGRKLGADRLHIGSGRSEINWVL